MTTKQTILAAADLIRRGWCQGVCQLERADGVTCYCLRGSIEKAGGRRFGSVCAAFDLVEAHLGTCQIALWNDEPERTQAEVVALLESVAASIKEI